MPLETQQRRGPPRLCWSVLAHLSSRRHLPMRRAQTSSPGSASAAARLAGPEARLAVLEARPADPVSGLAVPPEDRLADRLLRPTSVRLCAQVAGLHPATLPALQARERPAAHRRSARRIRGTISITQLGTQGAGDCSSEAAIGASPLPSLELGLALDAPHTVLLPRSGERAENREHLGPRRVRQVYRRSRIGTSFQRAGAFLLGYRPFTR